MKKLISLLLSMVMIISIVGNLNFSASAAEATPYFTEKDIQFLTSKFSYALTESEKAMYTDTIKNISPNIEWSKTDWDVVQFYCKNIQKVWAATDFMLPDTITENEFVKLGKGSLTYISSSIEIFKNIYYISQTDVNNIEKVYHGIGIFQSVCKVLGWSLGTFGSVLSVVSATLPIADLLYNSTIQEDLAFYEMDLQVAYYTQASLPTPDEAMVKPAFSDYLGKEELENGLYALYLKYSFMRIADNLKNSTQVNDVGEKSNYKGHTYQIFDIGMNWNEAKEYCEGLDGHLVTITSEEEQQFIYQLVSLGNKTTYWIGITDVETEGDWKWITGEEYNYSNWGNGEPNNGGPGPENWGEMITSSGKWNDGELNGDAGIHTISNHGFICEWDFYVDPYPTMNDEHHYEKSVILPTCTEDGYTFNKCVDCGLSYNSNHTSAMGHNYKLTNVVEQSCTSQGYDIYTCSVCGATEKRNYVNALGHKYEFTKTVTPTCSAQGYDLYTCSVCEATEKRNFVYANGHNYLLTNHIGSTCNTTGYDEYTCSVCGDVISDEIALLDGSALEAVLEEVQKKLSKNFFTTESIANLQSVYNKHKNGLDVYTAQIEVDNAVEELNTAISELIVSDTASGITENGQSWIWSRETGELKVVGEGNLPSYNSTSMPWCELLPYTISIIVDEGITSIGSYSFYKAENVTNISLPYGITTIGNYAFSHCSSVEELVVPNSVTSIGNNSFSNLTSLKKVSVPASTTYRSYAFSDSKSVQEIIITPGVDGIIPNSNITTEESGWSEIFHKKTGNFGPWKYTENATVTILEGVTSIGDKTFYDCYNVLQYNMPDSLTHIGVEAFRWCYNLKSIDIPKNVTAIDFGAFYQCGGLTNITIPNSVTTIGASAFEECNELTDITISESVINIGDYAFNYCFNLANVYYTGSQHQWENISIGTKNDCLTNANIYYNWIEVDTDALVAVIEMFDGINLADYSTETYKTLSNVVEGYRGVIETAQSQQEIDNAVTAILEAMYDLVPYLNLNISAENGSYEVQYDSTTSSDSKYSLLFGTEITLTAIANEGNDFVGWYDETSGVYLSKDSTYTFKITANTNIKAVFVEEQSATLTFTTYSNWVKDEITKTVDEWNEITSIEDMLPEVPYRYGYNNGRWLYDNEDVLSKLRTGENVSIVAEYDEDDTSLLTPPTLSENILVLDLYYKLDADENIGSFVMATGIPENCQIESVGMAFYYKNANQFDPENFELLLNNKMLTSTFDIDESNIYIANIERFTSKNNWAARGYIIYYDADGNLKTVYSNQINIVGREQV